MSVRRKLTAGEFLERIASEFKYQSPLPRLKVFGDEGLLIWRDKGVKTGVVIGPSVGGAFVFLRRARVRVEAVTEAVGIFEDVFRGEIVEIQAFGPGGGDIWLAHVNAPAVHVSRFDRSKGVEVPVFTRMAFGPWPSAKG